MISLFWKHGRVLFMRTIFVIRLKIMMPFITSWCLECANSSLQKRLKHEELKSETEGISIGCSRGRSRIWNQSKHHFTKYVNLSTNVAARDGDTIQRAKRAVASPGGTRGRTWRGRPQTHFTEEPPQNKFFVCINFHHVRPPVFAERELKNLISYQQDENVNNDPIIRRNVLHNVGLLRGKDRKVEYCHIGVYILSWYLSGYINWLKGNARS